jgi:hypothetical protein
MREVRQRNGRQLLLERADIAVRALGTRDAALIRDGTQVVIPRVDGRGAGGHGAEVGNDGRLAVIVVNVAAQNGDVSRWVALVAAALRPGKTALDCHPRFELESGGR